MRNMKIVALVVVLALISNAAFANLIVDLKPVSLNGTVNPSADALLNLNVGDQVVIDVWATVTGTAPYTLLAAQGGLIETPTATGLKGDMSWGTAKDDAATYIYEAPFNSGSIPSPGRTNAFGDIQIPPTAGALNGFGASNVAYSSVGANGVKLGHFTYTVKETGDGSAAEISFLPTLTASGAKWKENGATKTGATAGAYLAGSTVRCGTIPEPATLVLLGMGALALVFVRRRK